MKFTWKVLISFCAVIATAFIVVAAPAIRDQRQLLYPSPNSVSAFLKNYNPQRATAEFQSDESSQMVSGEGASAGQRFITNKWDFNPMFSMQFEKRIPLMNALNNDINAQLARYGAVVISRRGAPDEGFYFEYRLGKSVGAITVFPVRPDSSVHRNTPLRDGISDMSVRIEVTEKWFPYEAEASQANLPFR